MKSKEPIGDQAQSGESLSVITRMKAVLSVRMIPLGSDELGSSSLRLDVLRFEFHTSLISRLRYQIAPDQL